MFASPKFISLCGGMLASLTGIAFAHPHVFIDTGIHAIFDDEGRVAAIRVVWTYDDLFSLLVLEDLKLDHDYDGKLTEAEETKLSGFDMNWIEGYAGDTYALFDDEQIELSRPIEYTATLSDGRIVTTHIRTLENRVEPIEIPLIVQTYDPEFYTAYHLTLPTRIEGRSGCHGQVFVPDLDKANQILLDALAEVGADENIEEVGFPAVGADFAEEVRITCVPPS